MLLRLVMYPVRLSHSALQDGHVLSQFVTQCSSGCSCTKSVCHAVLLRLVMYPVSLSRSALQAGHVPSHVATQYFSGLSCTLSVFHSVLLRLVISLVRLSGNVPQTGHVPSQFVMRCSSSWSGCHAVLLRLVIYLVRLSRKVHQAGHVPSQVVRLSFLKKLPIKLTETIMRSNIMLSKSYSWSLNQSNTGQCVLGRSALGHQNFIQQPVFAPLPGDFSV